MPINRITWDSDAQREYRTGVDKVALIIHRDRFKPIMFNSFREEADKNHFYDYRYSSNNAAYDMYANLHNVFSWNGVTAVNESPDSTEPTKIYADNGRYLTLIGGKEQFGFTIEAYNKPYAFDYCMGKRPLVNYKPIENGLFRLPSLSEKIWVCGQKRLPFHLIYRVLKGNGQEDADPSGDNFEYHFIFNAHCGPISKDNPTINDSPEAQTRSYECQTTPIIEDYSNNSNLSYIGKTSYSHIVLYSRDIADIGKLESAIASGDFDLPEDGTGNVLGSILSKTV